MAKLRIRSTRRGWYRFWLSFRTGMRDWHTGKVWPDEYGLFERDIWVGPYESCETACRAELPYHG